MINNSNLLLSKSGFKAIKFIYFAIAFGLISFAVVSYFVISKTIETTNESLLNVFTFIVPSFTVIMIFISRLIFNKLTQQNDSLHSLEQKLMKYRTAKIISWALIESAGLLSVVAFILTKSSLFLIVFIVVIAAFVLSKPAIEEFVSVFNVDPTDIEKLN